MHHLILGATLSGKSTLAKAICEHLYNKGEMTLVLDPILDVKWKCDFITRDKIKFRDIVMSNENAFVFIDEAGEIAGQYQSEMHFLATRVRHRGHTSFFICQRATMVSPNVRTQCSHIYLFRTSKKDAKDLYDEYDYEEILTATRLPKGEFLRFSHFDGLHRERIF